MENKEKAQNFINNSSLSSEDKAEWLVMIENSPAEYVDGLVEIAEKFPEDLGWFNNIYKKKKEAFGLRESDKEASEKMLAEIYNEEKQKLTELYNKLEA